MKNTQQSIKLTIGERTGIFFWRNNIMPDIAAVGGKNIPKTT